MQYDPSTEWRDDFQDCNFVFTKKSGEYVYSFTKLQMLSNICKLALVFHDQVMQHYLKSIPRIGLLWRIIANKVLFVLCMIVYRMILRKRIIMPTDDAITICEGIVIVDFKICLVKGVITVKVTVIVELRWLVIGSYREQRIWWSRAFFICWTLKRHLLLTSLNVFHESTIVSTKLLFTNGTLFYVFGWHRCLMKKTWWYWYNEFAWQNICDTIKYYNKYIILNKNNVNAIG